MAMWEKSLSVVLFLTFTLVIYENLFWLTLLNTQRITVVENLEAKTLQHFSLSP